MPNPVNTPYIHDQMNKQTNCSKLTAMNMQTKEKSKQLHLLGNYKNNCIHSKREPIINTNKAISLSKSPPELKFIYNNLNNTQRNKINHLKHLDIPNSYSYNYSEQSYYKMSTQNVVQPLYHISNTFTISNYNNSTTTENTNLFNLTYELNSEEEY